MFLGLYTDESPGLKVDPVVVMTLSVVFIFSVVALHGESPFPFPPFSPRLLTPARSHRKGHAQILLITAPCDSSLSTVALHPSISLQWWCRVCLSLPHPVHLLRRYHNYLSYHLALPYLFIRSGTARASVSMGLLSAWKSRVVLFFFLGSAALFM